MPVPVLAEPAQDLRAPPPGAPPGLPPALPDGLPPALPDGLPHALPLELIERRITELAAHIHAATCAWLDLVAEFDAREGWAQWGCRSCSQWVSWRCGIAPVAAREHVRVARCLRGLPMIRAAFARGELSYSKVRALTRVEDVEDEAKLLELARHATAAQLERIVRGYRSVLAVERAAADPELVERYVSCSYTDDGSLVVRAKLPPDEGALLLRALEAGRDELAGDESDERDAGDRESDDESDERESAVGASAEAQPTLGERNADALLLMADTLLAGGARPRTGGDRYQVVVHVDTNTLAQRCELDDGAPIAAATARRLACDAGVVAIRERDGQPLNVGRKTRAIPPALRRALSARDDGCAFPGCQRRRHLDAHHIHHWVDGGPTHLSNLVHLCRPHHRLLHEGGFTARRLHGGTLEFRRPDGRSIPAVPSSPRGSATALLRSNRRRRLRIRPSTCRSLDEGAPFDLHDAVHLVLAASRGSPGPAP